jgi:hypothetical protein
MPFAVRALGGIAASVETEKREPSGGAQGREESNRSSASWVTVPMRRPLFVVTMTAGTLFFLMRSSRPLAGSLARTVVGPGSVLDRRLFRALQVLLAHATEHDVEVVEHHAVVVRHRGELVRDVAEPVPIRHTSTASRSAISPATAKCGPLPSRGRPWLIHSIFPSTKS